MPRNSKDINQNTLKPSAPNVMKAANKAKQALDRAGLSNFVEAMKLHGLGAIFVNPHVAAGFAAELAAKLPSKAQLQAYEAKGRTILEALGANDLAMIDLGSRKEVVVSIPLDSLDKIEALIVHGLKRSATSRSRNYVELRGVCDVDAIQTLVEAARGVLNIVERPASVAPAPQNVKDVPEVGSHIPDLVPTNPTSDNADAHPTSPLATSEAVAEELGNSSDKSPAHSGEAAKPAGVMPILEPRFSASNNDADLPPYLRRKPQDELLKEAIANAVPLPPRQIRPPLSPPKSDMSPR